MSRTERKGCLQHRHQPRGKGSHYHGETPARTPVRVYASGAGTASMAHSSEESDAEPESESSSFFPSATLGFFAASFFSFTSAARFFDFSRSASSSATCCPISTASASALSAIELKASPAAFKDTAIELVALADFAVAPEGFADMIVVSNLWRAVHPETRVV